MSLKTILIAVTLLAVFADGFMDNFGFGDDMFPQLTFKKPKFPKFGAFPEFKIPDMKMPEMKMPEMKFDPIDLNKMRTYVPGPHETYEGSSVVSHSEYSNINGEESSSGGVAALVNKNGKVEEVVVEKTS